VIHLDTHVVVWLYDGDLARFPAAVLEQLARGRPMISPMVRLELQLLHEIGRLTEPASTLLDALRVHADLGIAESRFERAAAIAAGLSWTRDPFDRLIAAHAMADGLPLLTRDRTLLEHCPVARWD
jgi:PIN domain nuclease of toxin-antitoxin system